MGILSLLIFLPLAGIFILALYPAARSKDFRLIALGITIAQAAIFTGVLLPEYLSHPEKTGLTQLSQFHFQEHLDWIRIHLGNTGSLDIKYTIGLDGLNFALIGLTVFILMMAAISSWNIAKSPRTYFMLFLLLDISLLGCFSALDLFLFFLFFEFMLLPMFFLIGVWGYERKEYAAVKFYLFTLFGSLFLLLVILGLAFSFVDPVETAKAIIQIPEGESLVSLIKNGTIDSSSRVFTFNMLNMMRDNGEFHYLIPGSFFDPATTILGISTRTLGFLCVLIAFIVKIPSVPFHTWLPDAHVQAPTGVSVILAGVLLKVGGYGIVRIGLGIFPDAFPDFQFVIALLGWASLIYGSFVAISQTDLKSLVAYSSIAHMGYVMLGIASGTATGINGAMLQMLGHGIISAALFLIVGVISDRTQDRTIAHYSGLWTKAPLFSVLVLFAFFASMGMPGLNAFIAELLVLLGVFYATITFHSLPLWLALTTLAGIILSAVVFIRPFRKMFFGEYSYLGNAEHPFAEINFREGLMLVPLSILMLLFGIFPSLLTGLFDQSVARLVQYLGG